ncbi:hypothetical protein [Aquabacterium sp. J223]|uniref:hypothetical protein n=1 Tax=Aquabacterium sp. J223 TaxID=2898431 RepID=UPI0021AD76AC|nr:hypothetical protein [Aquabacterium sp. J223]UUX96630.1 hypothetical protein LRS07_04855 [Aquabacterium sp. J223]
MIRYSRCLGWTYTGQQPDTANGVIFVSLEGETGTVQVICWKRIRAQQSTPLLGSRLLAVYGTWQRAGEGCSRRANRLENLTPLLDGLQSGSMDFHFDFA